MIPYTYCVFNKVTKQRYYGVRFAKNSNPQELWKTYFTSSKYVHKLIKQYGIDSFDYRVRKTFINKQSAILWENKVLRRLNVLDKPNWLNRSTNKAIILSDDKQLEVYKKISKSLRGKKKTESHINSLKFSLANRTQEQKDITRMLKIKSATGRIQTQNTVKLRVEKIKRMTWINNGITSKRVDVSTTNIPDGWRRGRHFTEKKYKLSPMYTITNLLDQSTFIMSRVEFCKKFGFDTRNISSVKPNIPVKYRGYLLTLIAD